MTPQSVFLRIVILAAILLLVSIGAMVQKCGGDIGRNCSVTINGILVGTGEERIEFGIVGDPSHEPGPLSLVIANLGVKPLTYAHHSTGPMVAWEFDVNGTIHKCETYGMGSGAEVSRTLQPKQAGIIPVRFFYARLPDALKKLVLCPNPRDHSMVDAKVRAVLSIDMQSGDGKLEHVKLTSDWSKFRIGFRHYPHRLLPEDSPFR